MLLQRLVRMEFILNRILSVWKLRILPDCLNFIVLEEYAGEVRNWETPKKTRSFPLDYLVGDRYNRRLPKF